MRFTIVDLLIVCLFVAIGVGMNLCPVSRTVIEHGPYEYKVTGFGWPFKSWVRWEKPVLREDLTANSVTAEALIGMHRPTKIHLPALSNNVAIYLLVTVVVLTIRWNLLTRK